MYSEYKMNYWYKYQYQVLGGSLLLSVYQILDDCLLVQYVIPGTWYIVLRNTMYNVQL
jgi:hypothetical protein